MLTVRDFTIFNLTVRDFTIFSLTVRDFTISSLTVRDFFQQFLALQYEIFPNKNLISWVSEWVINILNLPSFASILTYICRCTTATCTTWSPVGTAGSSSLAPPGAPPSTRSGSYGRVLRGEVWVQRRGVPGVFQAYPGEFLEEKFEFKDEEYLEFSKLTQVSS